MQKQIDKEIEKMRREMQEHTQTISLPFDRARSEAFEDDEEANQDQDQDQD